jgi:hypothetical protein
MAVVVAAEVRPVVAQTEQVEILMVTESAALEALAPKVQ